MKSLLSKFEKIKGNVWNRLLFIFCPLRHLLLSWTRLYIVATSFKMLLLENNLMFISRFCCGSKHKQPKIQPTVIFFTGLLLSRIQPVCLYYVDETKKGEDITLQQCYTRDNMLCRLKSIVTHYSVSSSISSTF